MNSTAALAILHQIVSILTGGIVDFATGIGTGLSSLAQSIMLTGTGDNQSLSVFAIFVLIWGAVGLTIGLSRFVLNWLTSWGK